MSYTRDVDKNLLVAIEASVDTNLFRHLYVTDEAGKERDVLEDGVLSCAYFTTSLLTLAGRIDRPHATVATTVKLFEETPEWQITADPQPGDVVYWPAGTHGHTHLGFYVGDGEAVSTSASLGVPIRHRLQMSDERKPKAFWRYTERKSA